MKRIALVLLLFFGIMPMHSQEGKYAALKAEEVRNLSYLGFNLTTPVDIINPRYRFSYLKSLNEKWMAGIAVGLGRAAISDLGYQNRVNEAYQLWEIRVSARNITQITKNAVHYIGPEVFFMQHSDVLLNSTYFPVDGETISYDSAEYQRSKYGLHLKYGVLFNRHRRVTFDIYAGVGAAFRDNSFENIVNPEIVDLGQHGGDMFGLENYQRVAGTVFKFNTILGVNLLYNLKKPVNKQ